MTTHDVDRKRPLVRAREICPETVETHTPRGPNDGGRSTPYGAVRATTGAYPTNRGFLNTVNDPSTTLQALGNRFYYPAIGKFLNPDPLNTPGGPGGNGGSPPGAAGNPQDLNSYSYSTGNPTSLEDPSGLFEVGDGGTIIPGCENGCMLEGAALKSAQEDLAVTEAEVQIEDVEIAAQQAAEAAAAKAKKKSSGFLGSVFGGIEQLGKDVAGVDVAIGKFIGKAAVTAFNVVGGQQLEACIGGNPGACAQLAILAVPGLDIEDEAAIVGENVAADVTEDVVDDSEQYVYRVHGGKSIQMGHSWTPDDPRSLSDARDELGLPKENSGQFLTKARVVNTDGVIKRSALAIPEDGVAGGGSEWLFPSPQSQLEEIWTTTLNPPL